MTPTQATASSRPGPARTLWWTLGALYLLWLLAVQGATILTAPYDHDEAMYLSAAALLDDHTLYADLPYYQAPLMPYVYRAAMATAPNAGLLAVGRWTKVAVHSALLLVLLLLLRRIGGSWSMALALLTLAAHNDVTREVAGLARNYDLATLFALAGLVAMTHAYTHIYGSADIPRGRWVFVSLAGLATALAVSVKLTFAPVALALMLAIPAGTPRGGAVRATAALAAGAVLGALPVLGALAAAGWDSVWFHNVGFHQANILWREAESPLLTLAWWGRLAYTPYVLSDNNSLLALALLVAAGIARLCQDRARTANEPAPNRRIAALWIRHRPRSPFGWSLLLMLPAALVMVWVPRPVFPGYYHWLLLLLPIWTTAMWTGLAGRTRLGVGVAALAVGGVVVVANLPADWSVLTRGLDPDQHRGAHMVRLGEAVDAALTGEGIDEGWVLTLSPLPVLEAGRRVDPRLAAGPFGHRVYDYLNIRNSEFRPPLLGAFQLPELMRSHPPVAILTGNEAALDTPLTALAREHGYHEQRLPDPGLLYDGDHWTLWTRVARDSAPMQIYE